MSDRQLVHFQHTVPRWHLKKFSNPEGWFWRYTRDKPTKRCRPKGECWERDFYEYNVNGKTTNNRYEQWLGRIESDAAALVETLLDQRHLTQREVAIWASYVASLFLRTQKVRSQLSEAMVKKFREQSQAPEFVRGLQHELLKEGYVVFADDLKRGVEQLRGNMEGSPSFYHLSGLEHHTASLGAALAAKTWHVPRAPSGSFFVMSDCPVTTVEITGGRVAPGPGFARETTAVILPLTPEHVFVACSGSLPWHSVATPTAVDSTNLLTVRFANKSVYAHVHSPEVKNLVDGEINQITFGKDAFLPSSQN